MCTLFRYREVLQIELPWLDGVTRAKQPQRVPVVLSRAEVREVLARLHGTIWLIVSLLYGSGMRVGECLQLRVKDLDFSRHELVVRAGKGQKDRVTTLPEGLVPHLRAHLDKVRALFDADRRAGLPGVSLRFALRRKYPKSAIWWGWQYVFPARSFCRDPYSGVVKVICLSPKEGLRYENKAFSSPVRHQVIGSGNSIAFDA